METISILWRFEDLACDWSENNEHSRHILGVHGFRSFTKTTRRKDDVERWTSKDSRYARNTERGYNVSVVWNKNGMHKSETKTKHGFYSKKRLKTTEILRSLSIFRVKAVHRVNKRGNSFLSVS